MKLKLGIAGCGVVAQEVHLPLLASLDGVQVSAVSEVQEEALMLAGRLVPQAERFSNYKDMLEQSELDALVVTLPSHLHAEAARAALSRRLHLYLEKPIASDLNEATKLTEYWASQQPRKIAMMGFNFRREPLIQKLHSLIRSGAIGKLRYLHSVNSQPSHSLPEWKKDRKTGGGVLLDLASHHLDLWRMLLGSEIAELSARLSSLHTPDDNATVEAITHTGVPCHGIFSFNSVASNRIELYGERGKLSVDLVRSLTVEFTPASQSLVRLKQAGQSLKNLFALPLLKEKYKAPWSTPSYLRALQLFCQCVRTGRQVRPNLLDGQKALELVVAAENSALSGRRVTPRHD